MPEKTIELKGQRVEYLCDECKKGYMVYYQETRPPKWFVHCCSECEKSFLLEKRYPIETWETR